jgi:DNA-binding NarL/FixJ family response regulator
MPSSSSSTKQKRGSRSVSGAPRMVRKRRPDCPDCVLVRNGSVALESGPTLSRRQAEVLECLATGYSNSDIAAELDISPETVKKHIQNLLTLLEASNRAALAAWWAEISYRLTH